MQFGDWSSDVCSSDLKATFEKNYKAYVELARDSAIKYGIPLTLDTPYNQPGIKSHLWVTDRKSVV